MTIAQIIFLITAVLSLGAAIMVVTTRNIVHAALWLIMSFFGIAVFYVLLNAGFFGVVQVVVYIGAIAILFIFAVMLTRRTLLDRGTQTNKNWWLAALVALLLLASLAVIFNSWDGFSSTLPTMPTDANILNSLGQALVSPDAYVLPFELASILLVAAMIGAIYVAAEKKR
jgi:NADH-quinone oxidoreductase subunit J